MIYGVTVPCLVACSWLLSRLGFGLLRAWKLAAKGAMEKPSAWYHAESGKNAAAAVLE